MDRFQALVARQDGERITAAVETLRAEDLPPGEVTIRVLYSSVNYKDALALTPGGGVVRDYPVVPGIDLTGEVVDLQSPDLKRGDAVLAHGYQIGTGHHGGYADYARLPADQVVPLGALSPYDGAAIGRGRVHCCDERACTARLGRRDRRGAGCGDRRIRRSGIDQRGSACGRRLSRGGVDG
jgi:acrylyl-CoA reductase (NADPH)